jgi:hypothetical protein
MKPNFFTIVALLFIPASSYAATRLPAELLFQSKPIEPMCIGQASSESDQNQAAKAVDLTKCAMPQSYRATKHNPYLIKQGYLGYDYEVPDAQGHWSYQGFHYYRFLGKTKQGTFIETLNNYGGSGTFSAIQQVTRHGNFIQLTTLAAGDRCFGGVADANVQGDQLVYSTNLTSNALIALADPNHKVDLEDCAVCCVAKAVYHYTAKDSDTKPRLDQVLLDTSIPDTAISENHDQNCFNVLIKKYQATSGQSLTLQQLQGLGKDFYQQCIATKS